MAEKAIGSDQGPEAEGSCPNCPIGACRGAGTAQSIQSAQ